MYYYLAFGLQIESVLRCPELFAIPPFHTPADVIIRYGSVPKMLDGATSAGVLYQAKPNQYLLKLEEIGDYLVLDGKEIVIQPAPGSFEDERRLFLLGSAFGALLHQRGCLILHGSAIATPQGAVVFIGESGIGKSTLAAAFQRRGYRVLTDDICAIGFDNHSFPVVFPATATLKLWADAAEKLAHNLQYAPRVRPQIEKYAIYHHHHFNPTPLPLVAVYELNRVNTLTIQLEALKLIEKIRALIKHTYRQELLEELGVRNIHFRLITRVAQQTKVCRVTRPESPFLLDELVNLLEEEFRNGDND